MYQLLRRFYSISSKTKALKSAIALKENIIYNWCQDISSDNFVESGCAVCGQLTPIKQMTKLSNVKCDLDLLCRDGMNVTVLERFKGSDPIKEIKGPVIDTSCYSVCNECELSLSVGETPEYALANGFWLGQIPHQLK